VNYVLESDDENALLLITGSILDHGSAPDHLVPLAQVLLAIEVASF